MAREHLLGLRPQRGERPFKGIILGRLTSGSGLFTNGAGSDIPWETVLLQTDPAIVWDGSATITIPPGYRLARVSLNLCIGSSLSSTSTLFVSKSGTQVFNATTPVGTGGLFCPICVGPFLVSAGDTIKGQVAQTSGGAAAFSGTAALLALCNLAVELIP